MAMITKPLLALAFCLSIVSVNAQTRTWVGSATNLAPNLLPTTFILNNTGPTLTINTTNAFNSVLKPLIFGSRAGTNTWALWPDGSGSFGYRTIAQWGNPYNNFGLLSPIVSYQRPDLGDLDGQQLYMVTATASTTSSFDVLTESGSTFVAALATGADNYDAIGRIKTYADIDAGIEFRAQVSDNSESSYAFIQVRNNASRLTLSATGMTGGGYGTDLNPDAAATATAFEFSTRVTHTAGTLLDVANNGTNKLTVSFDGAITTGAPTGGTAGAWKLGTASAGTFTADTIIEVEIGGTVYQIPARVKP